ncbi:MAG TPA: glycosyltransferase [Anaerolineae bacterium]|nr:glycosyltransferase [Anaerolineae bacterium]
MTTPSAVSIIVPVYNGGKNWSRCLDALGALNPPPLEILVIDDGSTDDSADVAKQRGVTVLQTEQTQSGPARARNLGAAHARGDILFFVDADVLVYPDAVERVTHALSDPTVSAIFGSYDDTPDDSSFVSQYKNLTHHFVHQHSRTEANTFWAGCGAIRRETFRQLGGFSTAYTRPSIEDIELGIRLASKGGQIRLIKDLQVKHLKRWTWRSLFITDIRDRALPWAELIVRDRQLPADLNLQSAHRISAGLCWLLLITIAAALFIPPLWFAVLLSIVGLVALNFDLYHFFFIKRGLWFALGAIPLHWFYYLYSSAAFAWVVLKNLVRPAPKVNATTRADL